MEQLLTRLLDPLLDLLFPPRCEVCQELGRPAFCKECHAGLIPLEPPYCAICGVMLPPTTAKPTCPDCDEATRYFDAARSVGLHVGPLRRAILNYKFHNARRLEGPLAELLADRLRAEAAMADPLPLDRLDGVAPIPLHPHRRAWRGFDQALNLCNKLSGLVEMPLVEGVLTRVKATRPQVDLSPQERHENVRGAFAVAEGALEGRSILLVDDVYTTGATANRAAQACKQGGAAQVYVLTISRPAPPWHPAALSLEPGDNEPA